jgi:hypothetical protein
MAKLPIDELRDRYDNLVKRIMNELKHAIEDLMKQKQRIMKQRKITIEDVHQARREIFTASREEFYADAAAKGQEISDNTKQRINELEEELKRLLETELPVEGRNNTSHAADQKFLEIGIHELNVLLNYIHQNSGVSGGLFGFRPNKGRRRHLPVEAIYNRINQLYNAIMTREKNEELNEEHFLLFKEKVENEADRILEQLEGITGVRRAIPKPRTARVSGALKKARRRVGGALKGAKAGVNTGLMKEAMAEQKAAAAVGGAIERLPNPLPSLRNWWASASSTAKRLREKVKKKKADVTKELAEVEAEAETVAEAESRFKSLLGVIDGIRKFNPKESRKLVGLVNQLSAYQSRIFEGLKKLRIPGLSKRQVEEAAAEVEEAAAEVEEAALEIEKELSKWQQLRGWLGSRMPDINLRQRLAEAKRVIEGRIRRRK